MLIVSGTGLVTDAYGLHGWGPYSVFKWVLMARLRRCRVAFVSVGAGPVYRPVGRLLVKAALSLADYRSYRDQASKDYLRGIGFSAERDRVYPDLVFGLPQALLPAGETAAHGRRRVVGLGLMAYAGRYSAAEPRAETYEAYIGCLADFAAWLLEQDYDIRLLLGDGDTMVIDDFRSVLRIRSEDYDEERVIARPIESVPDVLGELAATDVVVATRFHNVLLALLLNKPVIAISFHHKCSSLMRQMRLSEYCHDIEHMDADRLIEQFRSLEQSPEAVKKTIDHGVDKARAAVEEQYDRLFAGS
jgi:polysaccharide pyruvyl transferase WcaK-like protein